MHQSHGGHNCKRVYADIYTDSNNSSSGGFDNVLNPRRRGSEVVDLDPVGALAVSSSSTGQHDPSDW